MPGQDQTRPATFQDLIEAEARKQGIDPRLALAMVDQESMGDPAARSPKGAHGLFQLMPGTAKALGIDPADPVQNIRGGLTYLRQQLDRHHGDVRLALASYNAGPGAVAKAGGVPDFPETTAYVDQILGRLQVPGAPPRLGRPEVGQPPAAAVNVPQTLEETVGGPVPLPSLHGVTPGPIPSPTRFNPTRGEALAGRVVEFGREVGRSVDPRTREGRRNLAGGAGAALATAGLIGTAPLSLPATALAAGTAGVLGAIGGGMTAEAGEQYVGTTPASSLSVLGAGAQQGAYETFGQAFIWPIRAMGRRLIASSVGKAAHEGLRAVRVATTERLNVALDAAAQAAGDVKTLAGETIRFARRRARDAMRGTIGEARAGTEAAQLAGGQAVKETRTAAAAQIKGARTAAQRGVGAAELEGQQGLAAATVPYTELVGQAPSVVAAGRVAQAAIEGPATAARDLVGQRVEQAAREAPPVDITALKAEAQQILEKIAKPEKTFPRVMAEEGAAGTAPLEGTTAMARLKELAAGGDAKAAATLADMTALGTAQEEGRRELLRHPAMGVLNRILNADDVVPFLDAHLWKSEMQNALQGTYDRTIKKQVTSITQRLASGLREALAVHQPYNQATAAYAKIVPLYTKEYAATLRKAVLTNPEALIRSISPGKPTAARMLRDLLVTQSAEGGQAAEGQHAWNLVRASWTHENLLSGGIEQLDSHLAKLQGSGTAREFATIFYGDAPGQQVLQHLQQIAGAYKVAAAAETAGIAAAKQTGRAGIEAARETGRAAVGAAQEAGTAAVRAAQEAGRTAVGGTRRVGESGVEQAMREAASVRRQAAGDITAARLAKRAAKALTPEEARFLHSTLAGRQQSPEQIGADIARVVGLGPFQIWGGLSLMRLLKGPKVADLLEWAAYSPENTQRLVRLFADRTPTGQAIADVLRLSGVLDEERWKKPAGRQPTPVASHPQVGTPPPR